MRRTVHWTLLALLVLSVLLLTGCGGEEPTPSLEQPPAEHQTTQDGSPASHGYPAIPCRRPEWLL